MKYADSTRRRADPGLQRVAAGARVNVLDGATTTCARD
jgi:hypothetical protein